MKKIISLIVMIMFASIFMFANAQTKVELGVAGDAYWATDNAKVGMVQRQLATTNLYKDRFGVNNFLMEGSLDNEHFRAGFSFAHYGEGLSINDANLAVNLCHGLWINGGYYANWDDDYTYNKWFTGNSLVDFASMATPYVAGGLFYEFNSDVTLGVGLMNSAVLTDLEENNRSKSFYAKVDWNNLIKDWTLVASFCTGNEAAVSLKPQSCSEIFAQFGGPITPKLEGLVNAKFFMFGEGNGYESASAFGIQALGRYHFNEKFALGARVGFTSDMDGVMGIHNNGLDFGVVCEYNPVPFAYLRLEAGMLSLFNSDNENLAKIFNTGDELSASRMGIALSMGFKLGLLEATLGHHH
jgi:hypothetical protein